MLFIIVAEYILCKVSYKICNKVTCCVIFIRFLNLDYDVKKIRSFPYPSGIQIGKVLKQLLIQSALPTKVLTIPGNR